MANVSTNISDEAVLKYLKDVKQIDLGLVDDQRISIAPVPPAHNSEPSALVTIEATYRLTQAQLDQLIASSLGR